MNDMLIPLLALILLVLLAACSDGITESTPDAGQYVYYQSTPRYDLTFDVSRSATEDPAPETSVQYEYDVPSGSLNIRHSNALLSQEHTKINVRIDVVENILTIVEEGYIIPGETGAYYDIDMKITGLPYSAYRILFVEPNSTENELPLTFRMDLVEAVSGSVSRPQSVLQQN